MLDDEKLNIETFFQDEKLIKKYLDQEKDAILINCINFITEVNNLSTISNSKLDETTIKSNKIKKIKEIMKKYINSKATHPIKVTQIIKKD
jgi:hypothetical protein